MTTFPLGDLGLELLTDGKWRLDGGTMFGVVPKPLWEKECPPDEHNRIEMSCNCPLVRAGKHNILLDCGLGRKWSDKEAERYAVDRRTDLVKELARVGVAPEEVSIVVLSHLHLDHVGGAVRRNARGEPEPVFVNARHVVERRELEAARRPNELTRGSYLKENIAPLEEAGLFAVFEDEVEIVPGVTAFRTGGHCAGHLAVWLESGGQKAIFAGEVVPLLPHLRLPWLMAYDLFPLEMLEVKRRLFKECLRDDAWLLLDHDPNTYAVKLRERASGRGVEAAERLPVPDAGAAGR